ncbi:hypothetical protein EI94DRAFT_1788197 [Lactarius quietus]|nr:hypothetical protein EI94DRAFT_1788197 [Lactarius quietus]
MQQEDVIRAHASDGLRLTYLVLYRETNTGTFSKSETFANCTVDHAKPRNRNHSTHPCLHQLENGHVKPGGIVKGKPRVRRGNGGGMGVLEGLRNLTVVGVSSEGDHKSQPAYTLCGGEPDMLEVKSSISILIAYTGFATTNLLHVIMASKDVSPHHIGHSNGELKKPRMRHLCKNMQPAHVHALPSTPSPQTTKGKVHNNGCMLRFKSKDLLAAESESPLLMDSSDRQAPTQLPFALSSKCHSQANSWKTLKNPASKIYSPPAYIISANGQFVWRTGMGRTRYRRHSASCRPCVRYMSHVTTGMAAGAGAAAPAHGGTTVAEVITAASAHNIRSWISLLILWMSISPLPHADAGVQATEMEDRRAAEAEAETELDAKSVRWRMKFTALMPT